MKSFRTAAHLQFIQQQRAQQQWSRQHTSTALTLSPQIDFRKHPVFMLAFVLLLTSPVIKVAAAQNIAELITENNQLTSANRHESLVDSTTPYTDHDCPVSSFIIGRYSLLASLSSHYVQAEIAFPTAMKPSDTIKRQLSKIVRGASPRTAQRQLIEKILTLRQTSSQDQENIDYVLNSPGFYLHLQSTITTDTGAEAQGEYSIEKHTIFLRSPQTALEWQEVTPFLLHEFHHARITLQNVAYQYPPATRKDYFERYHYRPTRPFQNEADYDQLEQAIDQGIARILYRLPLLFQLQQASKLSHQESQELATYLEAAKTYQPRLHKISISSMDFHKLSIGETLAQGKKYKYISTNIYQKDNTVLQGQIFIEHYQQKGDQYSCSGFSVSDPHHDRLLALVYDHHESIPYFSNAYSNNPNLQLAEIDATIAENGSVINRVFFKEREAYHQYYAERLQPSCKLTK